MLKKKIDYGKDFVKKHLPIFQCPICSGCFIEVKNNAMICQNHHQFDVSKKGTVHFPNHHMTSDYDKEMLTSRRKVIQAGLYQPLIEYLSDELRSQKKPGYIVDMGCGEGSFIDKLSKSSSEHSYFLGFDLSKDGIQLASDFVKEAFFFIGDVTRMPFSDQSVDVLLNIFSPSHYEEMVRVLKPSGQIIKVIPEENYLKELRDVFYYDQPDKQIYSNENVYEKFKKELHFIEETRLTYEFTITNDLYQDVLKMSPIHWGASSSAKKFAQSHPLKKLTIDLKILIGKNQKSRVTLL